MEALVDDGEDERLGEADDEQADARRQDDLLQRQRREHMTDAGGELREEVMILADGLLLGSTHEDDRNRDRRERHSVRDRDHPAAERRVETGAEQR